MTRTSRTAGNESGCRFSAAFMDRMVKEMEGQLYDPEKNRRGRKIDPFKVSYYSHSVTFHPGNDSSCHRLSLPLYPADILILRDNDNGQKQQQQDPEEEVVWKDSLLGNPYRFVFVFAPFLANWIDHWRTWTQWLMMEENIEYKSLVKSSAASSIHQQHL